MVRRSWEPVLYALPKGGWQRATNHVSEQRCPSNRATGQDTLKLLDSAANSDKNANNVWHRRARKVLDGNRRERHSPDHQEVPRIGETMNSRDRSSPSGRMLAYMTGAEDPREPWDRALSRWHQWSATRPRFEVKFPVPPGRSLRLFGEQSLQKQARQPRNVRNAAYQPADSVGNGPYRVAAQGDDDFDENRRSRLCAGRARLGAQARR